MRSGRGLLVASTLAVTATSIVLAVVATTGNAAGLAAAGLVLALALVLLYVAVILWGVLDPRLALFAPVVLRVRGHAIALTFDDGPDPQTTPAVLDELARQGMRATFFVLGEKVRAAPDVLRAIARAGHAIGIHGDRHDRLLALRSPDHIVAELERARDSVARITGTLPSLFRPPLGHISPRTAVAAKRLGLVLVGWSVRGRDGLASTSPAEVERRVRAGLGPGAIVLLHDAAERGGRRPAGIAALPGILEHAARARLACVAPPWGGEP